MTDHELLTIPQLFGQTVEKHGECNSLAFVGEKPISYNELSAKTNSLIAFLTENGITKGDKVAILSTNMPNWGVVYLAATSMGAVVVPLLPDFSSVEIENILTHSDAKAIFVSHFLKNKINSVNNEELFLRVNIEDFSFLEGYERGFQYKENYCIENKTDIKQKIETISDFSFVCVIFILN